MDHVKGARIGSLEAQVEERRWRVVPVLVQQEVAAVLGADRSAWCHGNSGWDASQVWESAARGA